MAKREVNERWQREMADFFEQPYGALPDRVKKYFIFDILLSLKGEDSYGASLVLRGLFGGFLGRAP